MIERARAGSGRRAGTGSDSVLLRNLRVVDPAGGRRGTCDLWIRDGMLEAMAPGCRPDGRAGRRLRRRGWSCPGFFDMHVHLREPGGEEAETIATGALAAARGGFTGVACMPNTPGAHRQPRRSSTWCSRGRARPAARAVHPVAAITRNLEGKELTEMAELRGGRRGGRLRRRPPVESSEVMRRGMEYARDVGLPVLSHCEDRDAARQRAS